MTDIHDSFTENATAGMAVGDFIRCKTIVSTGEPRLLISLTSCEHSMHKCVLVQMLRFASRGLLGPSVNVHHAPHSKWAYNIVKCLLFMIVYIGMQESAVLRTEGCTSPYCNFVHNQGLGR